MSTGLPTVGPWHAGCRAHHSNNHNVPGRGSAGNGGRCVRGAGDAHGLAGGHQLREVILILLPRYLLEGRLWRLADARAGRGRADVRPFAGQELKDELESANNTTYNARYQLAHGSAVLVLSRSLSV